jgi:nitroreductase
METWDAVRARRNVRQYTDHPIARADLERICEAGRRAPSSRNWQPWDFVVVTGRERLIELAKAWPRGGQHIARSAADLGIGSGHSAVADQEQARRVLGFPDGSLCVYLIGLGYPADRPLRPLLRPARRPFDEVVHWDRW